MIRMSNEKRAWLMSPAAEELRRFYAKRASEQANILTTVGMESSDPKIRAHAASFATWTQALKELEIPNDTD